MELNVTHKNPEIKSKFNPLITQLKELNLISNKHIPEIYLRNSKEIRLRILAGLLDTDGSLSRNCYEITQKLPRLADDIVTLANSLGFFTRMVDKIGYASNTEKKTKRIYKRINIYHSHNTPTIPVLIDYKKFDTKTIQNLGGFEFRSKKPKNNIIILGPRN